jgi:hypothetical protein
VRIYVSGPYSADTPQEIAENVTRAIDAGIELIEMGHEPMIPHLCHWMDIRARARGIDITHADWMRVDLAWVLQADAILWLGSSPGADMERHAAEREGMPVYLSLAEVPRA